MYIIQTVRKCTCKKKDTTAKWKQVDIVAAGGSCEGSKDDIVQYYEALTYVSVPETSLLHRLSNNVHVGAKEGRPTILAKQEVEM